MVEEGQKLALKLLTDPTRKDEINVPHKVEPRPNAIFTATSLLPVTFIFARKEA